MVVFYLTGFGKFQGVEKNPTTELMQKLPNYLKDHPLETKKSVHVESFFVLETSGRQFSGLNKLQESYCSKYKNSPEPVVWLHFGVGPNLVYHLEKVAWNEADFRCPDERGWQPRHMCIDPSLNLGHCLSTLLNVGQLKSDLEKKGFSVKLSDDPGRFLCNYTYFESLQFATANQCYSLFVHVPSQNVIPVDKQLEFVRELMKLIADSL
jgi:pyroglutamyl-peptidase